MKIPFLEVIMKREKMIADELQCMFLEGKFNGFKEEYINNITKQLRTGEIEISNLLQKHSELKEKILEAFERLKSLNNIFKGPINNKDNFENIHQNINPASSRVYIFTIVLFHHL
jgi:hypothetical protein